jgi:hypothetical protein
MFRAAALDRIDAAEPLDLPVEYTRPNPALALLGVVLLVVGFALAMMA